MRRTNRMRNPVINYVIRSLGRYKKPVLVRIGLSGLLSLVITGTLLTGYSVRESLRRNAGKRLGSTEYAISSGLRFIDADLSDRLDTEWQYESVPLSELRGYCTAFSTGIKIPAVNVYSIRSDFFPFHSSKVEMPGQGEVVINTRLASEAGLKLGDEIILTVAETGEIAQGSPFAPGREENNSSVYRITAIAGNDDAGNFSLALSQIDPYNIFIGHENLPANTDLKEKANRILIKSSGKDRISEEETVKYLKENLKLKDAGFSVRETVGDSIGYEIISSRIFIDRKISDFLLKSIPGSFPVLTYLANSVKNSTGKSTPYSFVSAVGNSSLYSGTEGYDNVVINSWLAEDLSASAGDTISLAWYEEKPDGTLAEMTDSFVVSRVTEAKGIWGDRLLMPEFPGIAGSESCTDWDAGVEINMKLIRSKDEEYWNDFGGTPKAFINYSKGRDIWKNNYGTATAVRFVNLPAGAGVHTILKGYLNPDVFGIILKDVRNEAELAASGGTDFGTLFISLSFFMLLASGILAALSARAYIENRKENIFTLYALGFKRGTINNIFRLESLATAFLGSFAGALAAPLLNSLLIAALNGVWQGAVQTGSLEAYTGFKTAFDGFAVSLIISTSLMTLMVGKHIKKLFSNEKRTPPKTGRKALWWSLGVSLTGILTFGISFFTSDYQTSFGFMSGALIFTGSIMLLRQLSVRGFSLFTDKISLASFSARYYSVNTLDAIIPALFLATGLFAVTVTGLNRLVISDSSRSLNGGTGGYDIWAESRIPYTVSVGTSDGIKKYGLDGTDTVITALGEFRILGGDDASCLNLNHITAPPLLSVNADEFTGRNRFSFAKITDRSYRNNPWEILKKQSDSSTVYAIADQTVVQWGLKLKPGDTLKYKSENGEPVNVIIAATLNPSVFQGYLLIDEKPFLAHFPSASGYSALIAEVKEGTADSIMKLLSDRLSGNGFTAKKAETRLSDFFVVTNTYLSVFSILGAIGLVLGVFGTGFSLAKIYRQRMPEFALLLSAGARPAQIRKMLAREQALILSAGTIAGVLSAILATFHSLSAGSTNTIMSIFAIAVAVWFTGMVIQFVTVKNITAKALVKSLRRE